MDHVIFSIRMTVEQRERLGVLAEWLGSKGIGEAIRELIEAEFARQALSRSEIDGPIFVGEALAD